MEERDALTVTQLTDYIEQKLSSDSKLQQIYVRGEITNISKPDSGHIYFYLKDKYSIIGCAFFRNNTRHLEFDIEDGLEVIVSGSVSIYEKRSQYQIIISDVIPIGEGAFYLRLNQIKGKLSKEGLFDESHKKEIPFVPRNVGLICSKDSKAYHDILNTLKSRFSYVTIKFVSTSTQGENAPSEIIHSLSLLNREDVDVIILARGGGYSEDLMCFNDEGLARAIFKSKTPVVTAIGHQTDNTIADFVSDKSVATPSLAAKVVVPDERVLKEEISSLRGRLKNSYENYVTLKKSKKIKKEAEVYKLSLKVIFIIALILLIIVLALLFGR